MDSPNHNPTNATETSTELSYAVADAQALAREQVQAAWQLYMDRIREQLESGWRESLEQIYQERFGEIETRLRDRFESVVQERAELLIEQRQQEVRAAARRDTLESLNNLARRMRGAESRGEIRHALLDEAGQTAEARVAFFLPAELDLNAAPALANALESKDTVVAAMTASEVSAPVLERLGEAGGNGRVYLVPLVTSNNSVGVLAAAPHAGREADVTALELLATLAAPHFLDPPEPVVVQPPPPKPGWSDLSRSEQEVHLRAQRYARNRVAQLLLSHIRRVHDGRASHNLYGVFRNEIDEARNEFRQQYFESCPSMVDYLHLELVRSLAKDDANTLGPDYPGPVRR